MPIEPSPGRVIVVGGGPAGSLAAILLARHGVRTTLIEQHRFPRDKVCGECLSALGRQVLRRHGLDTELPPGRELMAARLIGPSMQATVPLPEPMLGLSRSALDATLIKCAAAAGADVRQPARVEGIDSGDAEATIRVRCLVTNTVETMTADYVLAADGRAAFAEPRPPATNDLGIKAHFVGVLAARDAITLYGGFGYYGGVAPIENGQWNLAFSVPRSAIADVQGDLDGWWRGLLAAAPAIQKDFAGASRAGEWFAAPLLRYQPLRKWPARVIPVGAAACAIEPVGGEGMGTALRSAELAAEAILSGSVDRLPYAYSQLWNRRAFGCRLVGRLLSHPVWGDAVGFGSSGTVQSMATHMLGK